MIKRLRHTAQVGAVMTVMATGLLVAGASPALADTSQATAQAAELTLLGGTLVDTGIVTATNDGTQPNPGIVTGNTNPGLGVLGAQTLLQAGVLVQQAAAFNDGTSAACAGVIGDGGTIQIGPGGDCLVTGAAPGGVVIDAGALITITADAILAQCTATTVGPGGAGPSTTGSVTLVNAVVRLAGVPLLTLPVSPAPGTGLQVPPGPLPPPIISLLLNDQSPVAGAGVPATTVTALDLDVLSSVLRVQLGIVTCGPNAVTAPIPVVPLEGLPIALATVTAAGVVGLVVHRRRRLAATSV